MSTDIVWYVAIGTVVAPRKFFNRNTQGFTDIAPNTKCQYTYAGSRRVSSSGEPYKIWARMLENDPDLVLWTFSAKQYANIKSREVA